MTSEYLKLLEQKMKRRASGEIRLEVKGLHQLKTVTERPGEPARESTVYVAAEDIVNVTNALGWKPNEGSNQD